MIDRLMDRLQATWPDHRPYLVGITGAVSAGKTTLARTLSDALADRKPRICIETVSTDGFLFANAVLEDRGLLSRKGFPESYDLELMRLCLRQIRRGPTHFPVHSHIHYDIDPVLERRIETPDVLILEGLSLAPLRSPGLVEDLDHLIYLDASEADLQRWYVERFLGFWQAAEHDPGSFYTRFRHLDRDGAARMAQIVWEQINLPNLRDHILNARDVADTVLVKGPQHQLTEMRVN